MTPEGAAASERLIACLIPTYLGCRVAFTALLLLAHSLYIYASVLLTLTLTWMTDCQTALAVLHTRAQMTALVF